MRVDPVRVFIWSRGIGSDILFAVTVPEAFAVGAGRTLVSRYRAIVWSNAAAALAIGLLPLGGRVWFVPVAIMLFNFGVAFWMFRVGQGGQRAVGMRILAPIIAARLLF